MYMYMGMCNVCVCLCVCIWVCVCAYVYLMYVYVYVRVPIPVAARSKAWVCDRSLARILGSNPAGGMDACLLRVLSGRERSLRRADHSTRGVLRSVVYLSVIVKPG
jgi:hypothetical protein